MKREDFKEITDEHFKTCEKLIKNKRCFGIEHSKCPFFINNATNGRTCLENGYYKNRTPLFEDKQLVKNAKEFLKFRENDDRKSRGGSMKREYFKEITDKHFEICEEIIKNDGDCSEVDVSCAVCPFSYRNATNGVKCNKNWGDTLGLLENAKEFLKFRPSRLTVVKINEEELEKFKNQDVVWEPVSDYKKAKHDAVNSPVHYQLNVNGQKLEVKDLIKAVVKGMDGTKGYYVGNVIKYILRAEKKNGIEDYKKARKYLDFIIGEIGE